jgi:MFS transporter, DHA2 family, methylenomycin A resistance protein
MPASIAKEISETASALGSPRLTLGSALLGFFVITLDAVVVNVALPAMDHELVAGLAGLQWVVDGYTLMFAALLLSAGVLSDRWGARRAFGAGLLVFIAASLACGLAPSLHVLVGARFVQGAAAAVMMPASMSLIRQAYPQPARRARAVAMWAMGGSLAATSGPVLGGMLATIDWRWIFFLNLPVGVLALACLSQSAPSARREAPFDWIGQATCVLAIGALTFGSIEAGSQGISSAPVLGAFVIAAAAVVAFVVSQNRGAHPMVPGQLFESRNTSIAIAVGFAFMVGYFGLPFVMSLYLQQQRGTSPLIAGECFLPMMAIGLVLTPFSARLAERFGARNVIVTGLLSMAAGLAVIAGIPRTAPIALYSTAMMLVGLAGPLVAPPITAVLLNSVPAHLAGTASGVYNTSRQVGGALAVALFGALLGRSSTFEAGMRASLLVAIVVALATVAASLGLTAPRTSPTAL